LSPPSVSDWPKCTSPTPYDVLGHPPTAPYTKSQFRQLVKLYHPDMGSTSPGIAPSARLRRYHLIVQAHDILSDPVKRRAYDATGAFWATTKGPLPTDNERYEAWRKGPNGSCANNANWEDWERWYEHKANANGGARREGRPYYMSNGAFLTLVISTVSILAVMQSARIEARHVAMSKKMQMEQEKLGGSLARSGREVQHLGRDERIERFLSHRENMAYGFRPVRLDEEAHGEPTAQKR
jgi:curved DNA-binding protein CbpA